MKKRTKVVDQQSCQEVEGINTYLVDSNLEKDVKIESLLVERQKQQSITNDWENRAIKAETKYQSTAEELTATKVALQVEQASKNEWENRAIKAEDALAKANSGSRWKTVLSWVGTLALTTIVGKAIENSSTQTINKTSSLFPVDEILSIPYEYAATLWTALRVFLG